MSAAIGLRGDFDAARLRGIAKQAKDGPQARRLLTLASIYAGATRTEAAKIGGVTVQIVRDWVVKFNARGGSSTARHLARRQGSRMNTGRRSRG
jgi:transposase